jgi:hypothetical protein
MLIFKNGLLTSKSSCFIKVRKKNAASVDGILKMLRKEMAKLFIVFEF